MSKDHEHITIAELKRISGMDDAHPTAEDLDVFFDVMDKRETCEICWQRVAFAMDSKALTGSEIWESHSKPLAVDGSEVNEASERLSLMGMLNSAVSKAGGQAKEVLEDWADGLRSIVSFPRISFVPVIASARGVGSEIAETGVMPNSKAGIDEGVFEIDLNQQESLFIKMEVDERISVNCEYNAIIVSEDPATVFTLGLSPNRKGTMLITEKIELGPGRYRCIILSGEIA